LALKYGLFKRFGIIAVQGADKFLDCRVAALLAMTEKWISPFRCAPVEMTTKKIDESAKQTADK